MTAGRALATMAVVTIAGGAAILAYGAFRVWQQGETDERRAVDAIVVLGAAHYEETPSAVFAARLDHAIELYRAGLAPYLVTTGGRAPGDRLAEADTARSYALQRGVPPEAILSEDQGRDTLASIRAVRDVLEGRGLRSALFVSDRLHMLRVLRIAEDEGIEAYGSPTTTGPVTTAERWLRSFGHELGGLAAYLFLGR